MTKLATAGAVVASLLVVLPSRPVAAVGGQLLFSETFANATTSAPVSAVSITSGLPCLTAGADASATPVPGCGLDAGADSPGSGALRLTSAVVNQASGVLYNTNLPLSQGLSITFDEYQYGGTGADGISFDLAVAPPQPAHLGDLGGSLGYARDLLIPGSAGMPAGWLGVGLDVFGNYTNPGFDTGSNCAALPGVVAAAPNEVTVRGPGNGVSGYCMLSSSHQLSPDPMAGIPLHGTTRSDSKRSVRVVVDPDAGTGGSYTVEIDAGSGYTMVTSGQLPQQYYDQSGGVHTGLPPRITFGFAGSTGAVTDIHEIGNVVASTLHGAVPVLGLAKTDSTSGIATVGSAFQYTIRPSVTAGLGGGDETMPSTITVTDPMPTGVSTAGSPTGQSWDCSATTATLVTCRYTGTGTIAPGTPLPAITVPVTVAATVVPGTHLTNVASVSSADAAQPVTASDDVVTVAATGTVTGALSADQTTVPPGALTIPLASLPAGSLPPGAGGSPAGALASTPISSIKVQSPNNVHSTPLSSIPLSSIPISSIPISSIPISSIGGLKSSPLSSIGLTFPTGCGTVTPCSGWAGLLAGTPLAGDPLQAVTLYDVLANSTTQGRLASLTLGDLDLSSTPLSSIPISSIMLAGTPISSIQLPGSGTVMQNWCALLAGLGHACSTFNVDPNNPQPGDANVTLFTLALAGVPISSIPISSIPISSINLGSTPLSSIPLSSIDISATPLSSIPLSSIPISSIPLSSIPLSSIPISSIPLSSIPISSIPNGPQLVTCGQACPTLGDAFRLGAFTPLATLGTLPDFNGTTLGQLGVYGGVLLSQIVNNVVPGQPNPWLTIYLPDIIRGLLARADYPWQALDLASAPLQALATRGGVIHLHETVNVAANGAAVVMVAVTLPPGFRYVPGHSSLTDPNHATTPLADPPSGGTTFQLVLTPGTWIVNVDAQPGIQTMAAPIGASAVIGSGTPSVASLPITVADTANDDTPATATALAADNLNLGYLTSAADIDYWTITVADGAQLSLSLSNLPADYDLVLYSPSTTPLRGAPQQVLPPVPVPAPSLTPGSQVQSAIPTGDIPLDSTRAVYALSARRGLADETINTSSLAGGTYLLQVSGYNGAFSNNPYALRAKVLQPASTAGVCQARTFPNTAPAGAAPAVPAGANTLFVLNSQRLAQMYGSAAATRVMNAVSSVAGDGADGVTGAVLDVSSDETTRNAYTAWDSAGGRCNVASANAVVSAIGNLIDAVRAANPRIANVVIVGADDQIPMARVPDGTTLSNERDEAASFPGNNALVASLAGGNVMTDDPYANRTPLGVGAGSLFLPEVALGRLVETPDQITGSLNRFVSSHGVITATTGLSTGYDFLTSGAQAIAAALQVDLRNVNGNQIATLINDTWTRSQLLNAMTGVGSPVPGLSSVNAHFDQSRALPAIGNATGNQTDLLQTSDIRGSGPASLAGTLLFSMGCHAGLNVPAGEVAGVPTDTWAKTFADQGALWVANTGYGYGDTSAIALSARLLVGFAQRLDGSVSIGSALAFAKQRYSADSATIDAYDMKALMESTLYGLPMYRLNQNQPAPPPVSPPLATSVDPVTGLTVGALNVTPAFQLVTTPAGTRYYTVGGQSDASAYRPIEPLVTVDVTQPGTAPGTLGLVAHGALITGLTTADTSPFNPTYATPVVDSLASTPPGGAGDDSYPSAPQRVATFIAQDGSHQQLALIAGQFLAGPPGADGRPGPGTQRNFTNIAGVVYYDTPGTPLANDYTPPTLASTVATVVGSSVSFQVRVTDPAGAATVKRVLVLYADAVNPGAWTPLDLSSSTPGFWTGAGVATPSGRATYIVQAVDSAGNVAVSSNKAIGHQSRASQSSASLGVTLGSASPPVGGFYTGPVTVSITSAGSPPAVSVDGGPFVPYAAPIVVGGDGVHDVVVHPQSGSDSESLFSIDGTKPVVTATLNPAPGSSGWVRPPAQLSIDATDKGGAGVGSVTYAVNGGSATTVPGAHAGVPVSANGPTTVTYFATDKAGNASAGGTTVVRVDGAAPSVTCPAPDTAWHAADVSFPCTATDPLSGLANPAQAAFTLATTTPDGTETPTAPTNSVQVCDKVANCVTAGPLRVKVDKKAPVVTLTAPTNATYTVGQIATIGYACTDSGSGVVPGSCVGGPLVNGVVAPIVSGAHLDTSKPGTFTFVASARDAVGHTTSVRATYTVTYRVCPLLGVGRAGHEAAILLTLCTPTGAPISSRLVLTAVSVDNTLPAVSFGPPNPQNVFLYVPILSIYGYVLNASKLGVGTHTLQFRIANDPVLHSVTFQLY